MVPFVVVAIIVVKGLITAHNVVRLAAAARGLWHALHIARATGATVQFLRFSASNPRIVHVMHRSVEYTVKFVKAGDVTVARVGGGEIAPTLIGELPLLAARAKAFSPIYMEAAKQAGSKAGPEALNLIWKIGG